ncbi:glycosyltransferase [Candidatus Gottesmanbacteria bacterium]|nr:glycosyltransferase [Candidatus Gottesmanbacteria bacterium]
MKIAIVHDSLVEFGGAERVLLALLELYSDAHVYTGYADKAFVQTFFPDLEWSRVHPSWVNGTIIAKHGSLFQCISPFVWRSFNLEQYDVVISATSYLAANMVVVKKPAHIQYIQSLPKNLFGLDPTFWLQKIVPYSWFVTKLFRRSLLSTPHIITNSEHTRHVLYEKTGVWSTVIYPPVDIPRSLPKRKRLQYYVCVSRIDRAKSLEISIEACTRLKLRLKIVGTTNEPKYEEYLRSIAGPTVEFLGFLSDEETHKLYMSAIAFIFPAKNEDFGIAPIEAMAHGVPVIAYHGGGLKDTVIPGKTGTFFYEHSGDSLVNVLRTFRRESFSASKLYKYAQLFSKQTFKDQINQYIHHIMTSMNYSLQSK